MNPFADEPTPAECKAVGRFGLIGLIGVAVSAWLRR